MEGQSWFNTIVSFVVLIGGFTVAITNIKKFFQKPVETLQEKSREAEEERVRCIFTKQWEIYDPTDKITDAMDKHFNRLEESVEELSGSITLQEESLAELKGNVHILEKTQKDQLREELSHIYYKYLKYGKIRDTDKKIYTEMLADYRALKGNGVMDSIDATVQKWEVVPDNYDFDNQ